ncbi:hypothetical protein DM02DRAFT_558795 [Periconia macrospinosa]|uniref:Polyketide synthase n=1 Tax=Periconia macrospinosa TaxID=97972 RepID=A0A2V1E093_9PLEO|nr:hypothetical protein DM02DRAFT_558795 [Periconia macrospinosa]
MSDCPLPALIAFGPSTSWPAPHTLEKTRQVLLTTSHLKPVVDEIRSLPTLWTRLVELEPTLSTSTSGLVYLEKLVAWLDDGLLTSDVVGHIHIHEHLDAPNTLLTPLTLLVQIVQYVDFLSKEGRNHAETDNSAALCGFCTGLLAACAVASSKNDEELALNTCISLRLAVAIGAFVDLKECRREPSERACCFAARWTSESARVNLVEVLSRSPGTYVSVKQDKCSVTVTTRKSSYSKIVKMVESPGLFIQKIYLQGQFHTIENSDIYDKLRHLIEGLEVCRLPKLRRKTFPLTKLLNGTLSTSKDVTEALLRAVLIETCDWASSLPAAISSIPKTHPRNALALGLVRCIQANIAEQYNINVIPSHFSSETRRSGDSNSIDMNSSIQDKLRTCYGDDAIAVVGMACRFPEADTPDEFWDLLARGGSTLTQVPENRFGDTAAASGEAKWGNFLREPGAFDHKFFKMSAREALYTDPQQRLVLEVAYEALRSSGYLRTTEREKSVGCYMGVGSVDYIDNIASNSHNAFSATGSLRAFISGKVSHYFDWAGPSLTFDTACSSSLVAIHNACKDIRSGECNMAIAGGVNVITSPFLYEALGAASFLSPTGASHAFEDTANGYCRGEGCGVVVLKRLSDALAQGDRILATIPSSGVNQNSAISPITVPVSSSQADLYSHITSRAAVDPKDVTYVEAHGTGTAKGDPVEIESIRKVFGRSAKDDTLFLGSVKNNIGHLEAASGIAALLKVILMIQKKSIPPHARFRKLRSNVAPLEADNIAISTSVRPWNVDWKAAVVNNYGASGCNASVLVCQAPTLPKTTRSLAVSSKGIEKQLLRVSAQSESAFHQTCKDLSDLISAEEPGSNSDFLRRLAFELAYRFDVSHPFSFTTTATSAEEFRRQLAKVSSNELIISPKPAKRPWAILCFGGQTRDFVGLDREVYSSCAVFKRHIDECDSLCKKLWWEDAIFPTIFEKEPVKDIVKLHCSLFALQYASAKSWINAGLSVETVVGHSFGQFTALCVAGILSLEHAFWYVTKRAQCIETSWSAEKGSMLVVEADLSTVKGLATKEIEIACHNAQNSFVLSGPVASLDNLEASIRREGKSMGVHASKRLAVTHGFHSHLMDPMLPELLATAELLSFQKPKIPIEECSQDGLNGDMTPTRLIAHSREPVYFVDAIKRISSRFNQACWIEAGSSSGITSMVKRILKPIAAREDVFLPMNLEEGFGINNLSDTIEKLSGLGVHVSHWSHCEPPSADFGYLDLPPYSFEKSNHWLPYINPKRDSCASPSIGNDRFTGLVQFIKFTDNAKLNAVFEVNCASDEYKLCVAGHAVAGNGLCPVSLYVEILTRAMMTYMKSAGNTTYLPHIDDLQIDAPLGLEPSDTVSLLLIRIPEKSNTWVFEFVSGAVSATQKTVRHAKGTASLESPEKPSLKTQRRQFQRLLDSTNPKTILNGLEVTFMQGPLIYDVFGSIVDYRDYYRGVKRIAAKGDVSVGLVVSSTQGSLHECVSDPLTVDNFLQVAGIHVNVLRKKKAGHIFVCSRIGRLMVYDGIVLQAKENKWIVYAASDSMGDNLMESDMYVSDYDTGALVLSLTGVRFASVPEASLKRFFGGKKDDGSIVLPSQQPTPMVDTRSPAKVRTASIAVSEAGSDLTEAPFDALPKLKEIVSSLCDIPTKDLSKDSLLEDIGVDSLLMSEVIREINSAFSITLALPDVSNTSTLHGLSLVVGEKVTGVNVITPSSLSSATISSSIIDSFKGNMPALPPIPDLEPPGKDISSHLAELLSNILGVAIDVRDFDLSLQDAGLDSLVAMEVVNDIKAAFGVHISTEQLTMIDTFSDLVKLVDPSANISIAKSTEVRQSVVVEFEESKLVNHTHATKCFANLRGKFDDFARETGLEDFQKSVYPFQAELVVCFVVEAFKQLGCDIALTRQNDRLPSVNTLPIHCQLLFQLYTILQDAGLIVAQGGRYVRTDHPVPTISAAQAFNRIIDAFPQHVDEHRLLNTTGPHLAQLLTGEADPIATIFGAKDSMQLIGRVYTYAPLFATGSKLLVDFLTNLLGKTSGSRPVRILEIGAGTGGTTTTVIETLSRLGVDLEYWFTDVSPSFVNAAKRKFASCQSMKFATVNIEKDPPANLHSYFDIAISTNCIHATQDLVQSTSNIRKCLGADGILCLLELTRTLYWFDLVFGLLDGWWRFQDGRQYALVNEMEWNKVLHKSGYSHVDWSVGDSQESRHLRLILASNSQEEPVTLHSNRLRRVSHAKAYVETVQFAEEEGIPLLADIYYPLHEVEQPSPRQRVKRPVALMIHGGGHIMLSRKDIRHSQIKYLFDRGFLPVSVDYRLCPEMSLENGPMHDVCTALNWIRTKLPELDLAHPYISADGSRVVAVGWSTGGTLAMSLAFKAQSRHLSPPDAILAFYCPTNYADDFWTKSNIPVGSENWIENSTFRWNDAVATTPITAYNISASNAKSASGGWMAQRDVRSQLALHMNWKGQTLPVLMGALALRDGPHGDEATESKGLTIFSQPDPDQLDSINPHSNVQLGNYRTPTFIIHGTEDDLIPVQQVKATFEAMQQQGVVSELRVVEGAPHLFDLDEVPQSAYSAEAQSAVEAGYEFLASFIN